MKISIDGNIGAGKTTVLKQLACEYKVILEPVEEWKDYLTRFYQDPIRWGFCFNLKVLCSFAPWKSTKDFVLFERSPNACKEVFTQMHFEDGNMDELEMRTFNEIYSNVGWKPDILIYIQSNPENCLTRIKTRGRESEQNITLEYLQKVHKKYELLASNTPHLYVIDAEKNPEKVLSEVKKIINDLSAASKC